MLKKLITIICLCAAFVCFPQTIAAQQQREVSLDVKDNKVDVYVDMRDLSSITSLQLSLNVTSEKETLDTANFTFEFNKNIENKIQKWTYQPEKGILNIYLADHEATTLSSQSKLHLGTLNVMVSNIEDVHVSVDDSALQFVNKDNVLIQEKNVAPTTVVLGKDNTIDNGDNSQDSEDNTNDNGNHEDNVEDDSSKDEGIIDNEEDSSVLQGGSQVSGTENTNKNDSDNIISSVKDEEKEHIKTGQTAPVALYVAGMLGALTLGAILVVLKKKQDLLRR